MKDVQPIPPKVLFNHQRIQQIANSLSALMRLYGYEVFEIPIIETADLFLTKAGDQIVKTMFTFERHGKELALRPEFTAPAAYYYITHYNAHQPVVRWQFSGPVFVDDPLDFTRNYQRYSMGAELIGMAGTMAEAEIISMAASGIVSQGITEAQLLIGHAGLTRQVIARFGLDGRTQRFLISHLAALRDPSLGKQYIRAKLDDMLALSVSLDSDTSASNALGERDVEHVLSAFLDASQWETAMGGRTRGDIARRLWQKRQRVSERAQIEAALDFLERWVAVDAPPGDALSQIADLVGYDDDPVMQTLSQWQETIDLLRLYDLSLDQVRIQPALARSWEYYTGIVFELCTANGLRLGGGGRYDELARLIGGQRDAHAVGFAYYVDEIVAVLDPTPAHTQPIVPISFDDTCRVFAVNWAQHLRARSLPVALLLGAPTSTGATVVIKADGSASLNNTAYTLADTDALIHALNGIYDER